MGNIALNGIGSTYPNPGTFIQINFASGPVGGSNKARSVILIGNGTSAATATAAVVYGPDTATVMAQESDATALFGPGSQLHGMYRRFTKINPSTAVYAIMVASSGGAAATGTITLTTASTAAQTLRIWVEDEFVDVPINNGDSVTTIATNAVALVNGKYWWAATAGNSSGVITLTANTIGPEGNALLYQAQILGGNGSTTVTPTANTAATGGTTADSIANALATIASQQFYYNVLGDSDFGAGTLTNIALANTQITNMAQPTTGLRQRLIVGSQDTIAHTEAKSKLCNNPRVEFIQGLATDLLPSSQAAIMAAIFSLFESSGALPVNRCNFSLFPCQLNDQGFWPMKLSRTGASAAPTAAQVTAMLNQGVEPVILNAAGGVSFSKRVTSYSFLPGTSNPDYRCRDGHIPTVCDAFAADAATRCTTQFSGFNLGNDPKPGQPVPPNTITPNMWSGDLVSLVDLYAENGYGLLVNSAAIIAGITVTPSGDRLTAGVPNSVTPIADQFCLLESQV